MSDTQIVRRGAGGDLAVVPEFTRQQINVIKQTIMPRASDAELLAFVEYARGSGLDPFSRQIYAIPKKVDGRHAGYEFFTGIDGLRLIAARAGGYDSISIEWCGPDGKWTDVWLDETKAPAAARATIWIDGVGHRFRPVRWKEFARIGRNGIPIGNWGVMPSHMLGKVAEAQALRTKYAKETMGLRIEVDDDGATRPTQVRDPDAPASAAQKGELHRLASVFGWDEDEYRSRLETATGKTSSKDLTKGEAHTTIDEWRGWETALLENGDAPPEDIVEGEIVEEGSEADTPGTGAARSGTDLDGSSAGSGPQGTSSSEKPRVRSGRVSPGPASEQQSAPTPGEGGADTARRSPKATGKGRPAPEAHPGAEPAADSGSAPSENEVAGADPDASVAPHAFVGEDKTLSCGECGFAEEWEGHHARQGRLA